MNWASTTAPLVSKRRRRTPRFVSAEVTLHEILIRAVRAHRQETAAQQSCPERVGLGQVDRQIEVECSRRERQSKSVTRLPDAEVDEVEFVILLA